VASLTAPSASENVPPGQPEQDPDPPWNVPAPHRVHAPPPRVKPGKHTHAAADALAATALSSVEG